jgi:signal transduction histidine kinase
MFNSPMLREVFDDTFPILEEYNRRNCDFLLGGLEYSTLKETVDQLFDGISIGSQQIKRIVTDLKNYARPAMFEMQQEVDLNEVVGASITLLNNMIKNATSNFSVAYLPDIPKIRGNFQRLEQVVVNLLQNACQALENKKQAVTVTIFQDRANKKVCVSVKDEGIGIPSDQIKFLCDPFFTTKRDIGGTGLGLSVASRIVRDHKATLGIRSTFGAGSEFTLEVPV